MEKRFYRSRSECMIAGVCGGVAEYFDLDPSLVRMATVLLSLAGGLSIWLYLIAWVVVPENPAQDESPTSKKANQIKDDVTSQVTKITDNIKQGISDHSGKDGKSKISSNNSNRILFGLLLIAIGVLYFINQFVDWLDWHKLWPLAIVFIGIYYLIKQED